MTPLKCNGNEAINPSPKLIQKSKSSNNSLFRQNQSILHRPAAIADIIHHRPISPASQIKSCHLHFGAKTLQYNQLQVETIFFGYPTFPTYYPFTKLIFNRENDYSLLLFIPPIRNIFTTNNPIKSYLKDHRKLQVKFGLTKIFHHLF